MRKLRKILIPLLVLSLLVGVFMVVAGANTVEQPTVSSTDTYTPADSFTNATAQSDNLTYTVGDETVTYSQALIDQGVSGGLFVESPGFSGAYTVDPETGERTQVYNFAVWNFDVATASELFSGIKVHGVGASFQTADATTTTRTWNTSSTFTTKDVLPNASTPYTWSTFTAVWNLANGNVSYFVDGVRIGGVAAFGKGNFTSTEGLRFEPTKVVTGNTILVANNKMDVYAADSEGMLAGLASGEYTTFEAAGFTNGGHVAPATYVPEGTDCTVNWYNPDGTVLLATTTVKSGTGAIDPIGLGGWSATAGGAAVKDFTVTGDTSFYTTTYLRIIEKSSGKTTFYDSTCEDIHNTFYNYGGGIYADLFVDLDLAADDGLNMYNNVNVRLWGVELTVNKSGAITNGNYFTFEGVTAADGKRGTFTLGVAQLLNVQNANCRPTFKNLVINCDSKRFGDLRHGTYTFDGCTINLGASGYFDGGWHASASYQVKFFFIDCIIARDLTQSNKTALFQLSGRSSAFNTQLYLLGKTHIQTNAILIAKGHSSYTYSETGSNLAQIVIGKDVTFASNGDHPFSNATGGEHITIVFENGAHLLRSTESMTAEKVILATKVNNDGTYVDSGRPVAWLSSSYNTMVAPEGNDAYGNAYKVQSNSMKASFAVASHTAADSTVTWYAAENFGSALKTAKPGVYDLYEDFTLTAVSVLSVGSGNSATLNIHGVTLTYAGAGRMFACSGNVTLQGVTVDGVKGKFDITYAGDIMMPEVADYVLTLKNLDVTMVYRLSDWRGGTLNIEDCNLTNTKSDIVIQLYARYASDINLNLKNSVLYGQGAGSYGTLYITAHASGSGALNVTADKTTFRSASSNGIYYNTSKEGYTFYMSADSSIVIDDEGRAGFAGSANVALTVEEGFRYGNYVITSASTTLPGGAAGVFALDSDGNYVYKSVDNADLTYKIADEEDNVFIAGLKTVIPAPEVTAFSGTVYFLKDVTLQQPATTNISAKTIVFDLGGNVMTVVDAEGEGTRRMNLQGGASLTFANGTVNSESGDNLVNGQQYNNANLTFDGVTVTVKTTITDFRSNGTITIKNGSEIYSSQANHNFFTLARNGGKVVVDVDDSIVALTNEATKATIFAASVNAAFELKVNIDNSTIDAGSGAPFTDGEAESEAYAGCVYYINVNNSKIKTSGEKVITGGSESYTTVMTLAGTDTHISNVNVGTGHSVVVADGYMLAESNLEGFSYTVAEKVALNLKANLTLYTTITYNLYLPVDVVNAVKANGVALDLADTVVIDGVEYYKVEIADLNANEAAGAIKVSVEFVQGGVTYYLDKEISIVDYLEAAVANAPELIGYVANYISAAYTHSAKEVPADFATFLDGNAELMTSLNTATPDTEDKANVGNIDNAFASVELNLQSTLKVVFNLKSDFTGVIYVNGKEYDVVEGAVNEATAIEVELRAYELAEKNIVVSGAVAGEWNLLNYVYASTEEGIYVDTLAALVNALYYYCESASAARPKA